MAEKIAGTIATFVTLAVIGLGGWLMLLVSWLFYKVTERFRFGEWKIRQTFWRWCRYSALFSFGLSLLSIFLAEDVHMSQVSSTRELTKMRAREVIEEALVMWVKVVLFLCAAHFLIVIDLLVGLLRGKYPTDDPDVDAFG